MVSKKMIMTGSNVKRHEKLKELDRGCLKKTKWDSVNDDMEILDLSQKDLQFRNEWRRKIKGATS